MRRAIFLVLAAAAGCFARRSSTGPVRDPAFECADRRMEYTATGTIMYAKQGVRLTCDGNVPTAVNDGSTIGDTTVVDCALTVFKRMSFPKPDGGGVVIVRYPIVLAPSD